MPKQTSETTTTIKFLAVENTLTEATSSSDSQLELKASYTITNSRSIGSEVELTLKHNDTIELVFDDNTTWIGGTEMLGTLFPEQYNNSRSAGDVFTLPSGIDADQDSRSIGKKLLMKVVNVFAKKAVRVGVTALCERYENKSLEGQRGLYKIDADFELTTRFQARNSSSPYLLFIHGTGSSTKGSFAELNGSNKTLWTHICNVYGDNILGFQHATLTESPLQNLLELLTQLPAQTVLHLITHSRGGLVGDLLVRFCENKEGFSDEVVNMLKRYGQKKDVDAILNIREILKKKTIVIEKYVRVACPAGGTSLMGKRVEDYFNVLINVLSLMFGSNANPLVELCKEVISEIVHSKNEVDVLPGLESMNPESLFVKILRSPNTFTSTNPYGLFTNELAVISGNGALSLSLSGLGVLLSKVFFSNKRNDLIVNTNSMYLGLMRSNPIQYYYDEGSDVNHFSYFKNADTQTAILDALRTNQGDIPNFKKYVRGSADESVRGIGIEYGRVNGKSIAEVKGDKPIVILLPGIMGSVLEKNKNRIWLEYLRMMTGGLSQLAIDEQGVEATGLIKTSYKKIIDALSDKFDVITFAYDWRKSISQAGLKLEKLIQELTTKHKQQTISFIAHSMGGLVVRDFIFRNNQLWQNLNKRPQFKFIMLGTPWMGSYRIPYVLAGKDNMVKLLGKIDFIHHKEELIEIFSKYPGLLNLLPTNNGSHDFSKPDVWKQFQKASGLNWTIPSQDTLAAFGAFRGVAQNKSHTIDTTNIIYIAGKDSSTPQNFNISTQGELQFFATAEGDQSVTWATGIPSNINRETSLYYTNITHGALANDTSMFAGIKELLEKGTTSHFYRKPEQVPEKKRSFTTNDDTDVLETDEVSVIAGILGLTLEQEEEVKTLPPLKISVTKGDLKYSKYPVMLGHFNRDGILNAEWVADSYLNNALSEKHRLGVYPGPVGTYDFFLKNTNDPNAFKGVIIIGLGEVEKFSQQHLAISVEKACISYLLNRKQSDNKDANPKKPKGISVLMIGAGYGRLSVESSCLAILQGISNANAKVFVLKEQHIELIERVEFVELFEDKAINCFKTLDAITAQNYEGLSVAWHKKGINQSAGFRKRLSIDSSSDWWQRISVLNDENNSDSPNQYLSFYSSTASAREEKKDLRSNFYLLQDTIQKISMQERWNPEDAKVIFEMLIPNDFKENISSRNSILWVLDKHTAMFPWELLQASLDKNKPLCVNARMIRQLATNEYRNAIYSSKNNQALIIGDPNLEGLKMANQLAGAEREASLVYEQLRKKFPQTHKPLIKSSSDAIMKALHVTDYKIVHIAAHGIFNAENNEESGILIGKYMEGKKERPLLLTTNEFNQMQVTPELVFINCCYSGTMNAQAESLSHNRTKLAANIGTQLIEMGVKAVVVTGWAVDDHAAYDFADVFYKELLAGKEFATAVQNARKEVFSNHKTTNTWGAYQCYGDPFYTLTDKKETPSNNTIPEYFFTQEAEYDLVNLVSKSKIDFYSYESLYDELKYISKRIEKSNIDDAEILEIEAYAYSEFNQYEIAIQKYEKLFKYSEKTTYNVKAIEKYCNIYSKHILNLFTEKKVSKKDSIRNMVDDVLNKLYLLQKLSTTSERNALIAGCYKRLAIIDNSQFEMHMKRSAYYYQKAYHNNTIQNDMYSYCNWITAELFITERAWGEKLNEKLDFESENISCSYSVPTISEVYQTLDKHIAELDEKLEGGNRNYWDIVSRANALHTKYIISDLLKQEDYDKVVACYQSIWSNEGSRNKIKTELDFFETLIHFCEHVGYTDLKDDIQNMWKLLKAALK